MRGDETSPIAPDAPAARRPWEPPRLLPLDLASTESADVSSGSDLDGGPASGGLTPP